jgi:hypothetical protein
MVDAEAGHGVGGVALVAPRASLAPSERRVGKELVTTSPPALLADIAVSLHTKSRRLDLRLRCQD